MIGFIGLGHMGGAMARRLLSHGFPLLVLDRDDAAVAALAPLGAEVAVSPLDLANRADTVFLCLPSLQAQQDVCCGPVGMVGGSALRVVVETSTVGPHAVRALAGVMQARGMAVVDAPISGGPRGAANGSLSMMVAGEAHALASVQPMLEALAGKIFHVGSTPGLAQVCKLVNNAISAAGMVAACEATLLGAKAGLDADTMLAAINAGSGRNAATLDKFPAAILNGSFDYGGPMGLMLKDLSLFMDAAREQGTPDSMAQATFAAWNTAVQRTGFDADYSRLIEHLEADAGVVVRSKK